MKRLLLSLSLVGAVFPGYPPTLPQTMQSAASAEQLFGARAAPGSGRLKSPQSALGAQHSGVEQVAVRSPTAMLDAATPRLGDGRIKSPSAPLPSTLAAEPPLPQGNNGEAIWVEVIRGATVHSGSSVSAPRVRFYGVGTELNLIGYRDGWFQVSDPATSEQGWIYEKYYLQAIRSPGQEGGVLQNSQRQAAFQAPKSIPHVRRVRKPTPRQDLRIQSQVANARIQNESVASLVEKAFRGH
jgi:hypothetical protein